MKKPFILAVFGAITAHAAAAGRLVIEQAWIRTPPPGAMMLAGYATLRNDGDAPVVIVGASSAEFGAVSVHQSSDDNGVEKMRALSRLEIGAGSSVILAPGGKHLMLMRPRQEFRDGDTPRIHLSTESGDGASADFSVRAEPPAH